MPAGPDGTLRPEKRPRKSAAGLSEIGASCHERDSSHCIAIGQEPGLRSRSDPRSRAYAVDRPHWVLRDGPPSLRIVAHLRDWRPHGIIASLVLPRVAHALIRMRKQLIDTAYVLPGLKVPTVDVDHTAVGRLAADYFLAAV